MRKLQSFIFRVLLLLIAVFLIYAQGGVFNGWIYAVIILIYAPVFYVLRDREIELPRLFWDFLFINSIVYGRDLSHPIAFFFVLMPLINAINYTGKISHYFILLFLTICTILINLNQSCFYFILPIVSLLGMYVLANTRYERWNFDKELTSRIDKFFLSPDKPKSHQIYPAIIDELNRYAYFSKGYGIDQIRAYRLKGDKMWLVNASKFIWERCETIPSKLLANLKNHNNHSIGIENNGIHNFYCYVRKEDVEYIFVAIAYCPTNIFFSKILLLSALPLTCNKLALLLNTEYRLQQRRDEKFREIKDYVLYVNKATRLMHFIRNSMTPITNLIAYHNTEALMKDEVKQKMKPQIDKIYAAAQSNLTGILKFANYLLDDSNNPYAEDKIIEIGIHKLYIIVSELAQHYLDISVDLQENLNHERLENRVVHTNLMQFKILILDWIENMRKYGRSYYFISMQIENEQLIIHFENDCLDESEELRALVRNLNSTAKDAVLEGKNLGHGIFIIIGIARQLGIEICARNKTDREKQYILSLDFKLSTYERKENINI